MGRKKLRASFKSSFWENKIQKDVGLLKVLTEKSVGDFSNLFEIPKTKFKSRCFVWTANICIQLSFDKLTETLREFRSELFSLISDRDRKPETFLRMILLLVFSLHRARVGCRETNLVQNRGVMIMRLRWKLFQAHNSMIPVGDRPIRLKISKYR